MAKLVEKTKSFLFAFFLLIALDTLSFTSLVELAKTHKDILSISTTILILGMCLWISRWKKETSIDKPIPTV
jgi:hypothetical protein